jgi:hypothetical protein
MTLYGIIKNNEVNPLDILNLKKDDIIFLFSDCRDNLERGFTRLFENEKTNWYPFANKWVDTIIEVCKRCIDANAKDISFIIDCYDNLRYHRSFSKESIYNDFFNNLNKLSNENNVYLIINKSPLPYFGEKDMKFIDEVIHYDFHYDFDEDEILF